MFYNVPPVTTAADDFLGSLCHTVPVEIQHDLARVAPSSVFVACATQRQVKEVCPGHPVTTYLPFLELGMRQCTVSLTLVLELLLMPTLMLYSPFSSTITNQSGPIGRLWAARAASRLAALLCACV